MTADAAISEPAYRVTYMQATLMMRVRAVEALYRIA